MERVSGAPRETESPVFRPAGISYLRLPSADPKLTASFLEAVFGWQVDTAREDPSFEDGTGHVIGHVDGRMEVAGQAGVRPYVYVESVAETLERVTANGGEVVTPPFPEGDLVVAVFREPGGNAIGAWQRA